MTPIDCLYQADCAKRKKYTNGEKEYENGEKN